MKRPRLFAEIPAGLASVSLCLHGGLHCRPPIARIGNKVGFAEIILRVMGLSPMQRAEHYLWVDADRDVLLLLQAYTDPTVLKEVSDIIYSWREKDIPSWYAELKEKYKAGDASLADWLVLQSQAVSAAAVHGKFNLISYRKQSMPGLSAAVERLAEYVWLANYTFEKGSMIRSGFEGNENGAPRVRVPAMLDKLSGLRSLHLSDTCTTVTSVIPTAQDVSKWLGTPGDLSGVILYSDPPYVGTTPYAHDLGRDEVVRMAREWDSLGAAVYISEAEPVIPDWECIEITDGRKGAARTFSAQKAEYLTMNRPTQFRLAEQIKLF